MSKHLILSRDPEGDWYKRAQDFLTENNCKPLDLKIKAANPADNAFISAMSALAANTGNTLNIDQGASVFVISANSETVLDDMSVDAGLCRCQCGAAYSCGGGGGGS